MGMNKYISALTEVFNHENNLLSLEKSPFRCPFIEYVLHPL